MSSVIRGSDNFDSVQSLKGFKNYIINGNFDIWQRGDSGNATNVQAKMYAADRWIVSGGMWSKDTLSATNTPFYSFINVKGTGDVVQFAQRIESQNAIKLYNKTATLSFYCATSITTSINVRVLAAGSKDNYTSPIVLWTGSVLSTSGSGGSVQVLTIPASALTSSVKNGIQIDFATASPLNSSQVFLLTGVQLEEGSVATPFENRPYGLELSLCQRYYETIYFNSNGSYYTGQLALNSIEFAVEKRTVPTVIFTNLSYTNANSLITNGLTNKSITLQITSTSNLNMVNGSIYLSAEV